MGNNFFLWFILCMLKNSWKKKLLNVVIPNPFVGIAESDKAFQIKIILCWTIISFICALIS